MAGRKGKKPGRFKLKCQRYSNERRRDKSKKRKLAKHLRNHSNDRQAFHAHANIFV